MLAYGEIAAFYRLTDEAKMAPDLRGRISMASMAAAEMQHYEQLRDALESRGVDVVSAMSKYVSALENYHRLTMPSTWLEALVKTYVGDALAADLYLEIADGLPDEVADVVRAALAETGHSQFVVAEVRAAVTSSSKQRSRLALWARRLLGEAITQAQYLLADHDELVDLVVSGAGGWASSTRSSTGCSRPTSGACGNWAWAEPGRGHEAQRAQVAMFEALAEATTRWPAALKIEQLSRP